MREKVVKIKTTVTDASVSPSKSNTKLYFVTWVSSSPLRIPKILAWTPKFLNMWYLSTSQDLYKFLGAYIIIEYFAFCFLFLWWHKIKSTLIIYLWTYEAIMEKELFVKMSFGHSLILVLFWPVLTFAFLLHPLSPPHFSCLTPKYNKSSFARFLCCLSLLLKISPSTPSGISNKEIVMSAVKITC